MTLQHTIKMCTNIKLCYATNQYLLQGRIFFVLYNECIFCCMASQSKLSPSLQIHRWAYLFLVLKKHLFLYTQHESYQPFVLRYLWEIVQLRQANITYQWFFVVQFTICLDFSASHSKYSHTDSFVIMYLVWLQVVLPSNEYRTGLCEDTIFTNH